MKFEPIKKITDRAVELAGGGLLLVVTILAIIQVLLRYVFNYAFIWSEEFSRLTFVWIILLGAALGVSQKKHMVIDFFQRLLPIKAALILNLVLQLLGLVFLLVVVVKGVSLLRMTSTDMYVTLPFSVMYAYLSAVVGGGLMIFYWLREIAETLRRLGQSVGSGEGG